MSQISHDYTKALKQKFIALLDQATLIESSFTSKCTIDAKSILEKYDDLLSYIKKEILKENIYSKDEIGDKVLSIIFKCIPDAAVKDNLLSLFLTEESKEAVAQELVSFIDSLPITYDIYFQTSLKLPDGKKDIRLSEDVLITYIEDMDSLRSQESKDAHNKNNIFDKKAKIGRTCIKISAKGFATTSINSSALSIAYTKLKHFMFLGKAYFLEEKRNFGLMTPRLTYEHWCHDPNTNERMQIYVPTAAHDFLSKIQFTDHAHTLLSKNKEFHHLAYDLGFEDFLEKKGVTNFLNNYSNATYIGTAIDWAFESWMDKNETFSFIKGAIGIEALLGDEKPSGRTTEKLGDRCGYLLGKTKSERNKFKEAFTKLYDLRSDLVHGREASLNEEERHQLTNLQNLLKNLILKEIYLLNTGSSPDFP